MIGLIAVHCTIIILLRSRKRRRRKIMHSLLIDQLISIYLYICICISRYIIVTIMKAKEEESQQLGPQSKKEVLSDFANNIKKAADSLVASAVDDICALEDEQ
jgi:hypothetical protein